MKKEIKIIPMGASVTLTELNRLRKKANRDWKRFERLEKIHDENHTTADMDSADNALDLWAESQTRFNEALTGRKRMKDNPPQVINLEHDPGGVQYRENC